jgi:hypothetical protein
MTLEELLEKYVEYNNRADPTEIAAFNKIKEEIGEHIADIAVGEKFGLEAQARSVPRRGRRRQKGPPVLDRVYELAPGKNIYADEGAFIIADAKFGESDLARSNFRRRFLVEGGKMTPVPARFQITQLDPDWIWERIREVARREAEVAAQQGVTLQSSLADELDRAARENRLRIIEVRGSLDLQNGQIVGINGEIVDHTILDQLLPEQRTSPFHEKPDRSQSDMPTHMHDEPGRASPAQTSPASSIADKSDSISLDR